MTTVSTPTHADILSYMGQTVTIRYMKTYNGLGATQHTVTGYMTNSDIDDIPSVIVLDSPNGTWLPLAAILDIKPESDISDGPSWFDGWSDDGSVFVGI